MKKMINKILVAIFVILCLLGTLSGVSNAFNVVDENGNNLESISDDYDLATWARDHRDEVFKADCSKLVGQTMKLHYGGGVSTIGVNTAACMYHQQNNIGSGYGYKIANVIDIAGRTATIYTKSTSGVKTKTYTSDYMGAIAYATAEALKLAPYSGTWVSNTWKNVFTNLFFDSGIKSKISKDFRAQICRWPNDSSKYKEALTAGKKYKKAEKAKIIDTSHEVKDDDYLGPFKMNKGGYTPVELTVSVNGKTAKKVKEFYTKNSSGNYVKNTDISKLKNGKAFYVKFADYFTDDADTYKVKLKLKCGTAKCRIILISNPRKSGQNLGITVTPEKDNDKPIEDELEWSNESGDKGKLQIIKKDKDSGAALKGARFTIEKEGSDGSYSLVKTVKITNKNGKITVKDLEIGNYKVTEIEAPTGYSIGEPNPQIVEVKKNKTVKVTFEDPKGNSQKVTVYKVDEDTLEPIKGAKFTLYTVTPRFEPVRDENGNPARNEQGSILINYYIDANNNKLEDQSDASKYTWPDIAGGEQWYCSASSEKETDESGEASWYELKQYYRYVIYETSVPSPYDINKQRVIGNANATIVAMGTEDQEFTYVNRAYGSINIHKVDTTDYDEDADIALAPAMQGAIFKVYYYDDNNTKQYLADTFAYPRKKGYDNFTTDVNAAQQFVTDANGNITIDNLPCYRTYYAVEVGFTDPELADYYKISDEEYEFNLDEPETSASASVVAENKWVYTKISGKVWEDDRLGKIAQPNDLYDNGENLINGITVKLVYRESDTVVKDENDQEYVTTTYADPTYGNGYYCFKHVLIDAVEYYSVMFEYNGLKYKDVNKLINEINGSKAEEIKAGSKLVNGVWNENDELISGEYIDTPDAREEFNKQYSTIENNVAKNGTATTNNLSYKYENHESTLVQNLGYTADGMGYVTPQGENKGIKIEADTRALNLEDYYEQVPGKRYKIINNINLGMYERAQPTISVKKDIENIEVDINGIGHRYDYDQRFSNMNETGDGYDVGVKFGNKYGKMRYTRPIYKADAEWTLGDNQLEVFITYKIGIQNSSTNLKAKINSLVDYFDSNYTWIENPYELDGENKEYLDLINSGDSNSGNANYSKITIDTSDVTMEPESERIIYLRLKLTRAAVSKVLGINGENGEGELLDNIVEINSYSIFDGDGAVYAGIDKISNPGSVNPGSENTYENDTDTAPALQLTVAETRSITGTVFLDKTEDELKTGEKRAGDGKYGDDDSEVKNVTVSLIKINRETGAEEGIAQYYNGKDWTPAEIITTDGNYRFEGFIPDEYIVRYTWGQEQGTVTTKGVEINVQDYKATEYNNSRYNVNSIDNADAKLWYKGQGDNSPSERYSDALDNYETRKQIDGELTYIDRESNWDTLKNTTYTEMRSSTFKMYIPVEYKDTSTDTVSKYIDEISENGKLYFNVQNVDFGIVERARQEMETKKRVSSIKITLANGEVISDAIIDENGNIAGERKHLTNVLGNGKGTGFVKAELDNELIQGSTLQIGYTITVYNNSELDYATQEFYERGIIGTEDEKIKIRAVEIIDYADNDWDFIKDDNPGWEAITYEEIKDSPTWTDRSKILLDGNVVNYNISQTDIVNRMILHTTNLQNTVISPASQASTELKLSKLLTISDDIQLNNETEIIKIINGPPSITPPFPGDPYLPPVHTGRIIPVKPGNYIPGTNEHENDGGSAETVEVTPSTGGNKDYIFPIGVGLIALITLGAGVVLIKKFVIGKE